DIEQPTENSDADDAVEYALARGHAEPVMRDASHNSGGGHGQHEDGCYPGHAHRIPRSGCLRYFGCRPEDKPDHSYIRRPEQQVDEPDPGALKEDVKGDLL